MIHRPALIHQGEITAVYKKRRETVLIVTNNLRIQLSQHIS